MKLMFFFCLFTLQTAFSQSTTDTISAFNQKEYITSHKLSDIPQSFFKLTGLKRQNITTKKENFSSGCVQHKNDKKILLNFIKTNKEKNIQIIRLSYGGKSLIEKEYYLSYKKGDLQIKEKVI